MKIPFLLSVPGNQFWIFLVLGIILLGFVIQRLLRKK